MGLLYLYFFFVVVVVKKRKRKKMLLDAVFLKGFFCQLVSLGMVPLVSSPILYGIFFVFGILSLSVQRISVSRKAEFFVVAQTAFALFATFFQVLLPVGGRLSFSSILTRDITDCQLMLQQPAMESHCSVLTRPGGSTRNNHYWWLTEMAKILMMITDG